MMQVIVAVPPLLELYDPTQPYPPMLEQILADLRGRKPIIFAWGDRLFNPQGAMIPPELMAHEAVHLARQTGTDIGTWWRKYIESPNFRLEEEIPAHRAEYAELCRLKRDRNQRALELHRLALRLSGPLYGSLIDYPTAKQAIAGAEVTWPENMPGYREGQGQSKARFRARVEDAHNA